MRVVIAVDLSEAGMAGVKALAMCPPAHFERVTLVHAVDLDLYTAGGTIPEVADLARERLEAIAERLRASGFEAVARVEIGPAVETIQEVVAEDGAELLVMTSLGKGAVAGRIMGSTAERLASGGAIPVLVERVVEQEGAWCRLERRNPFARPLVGSVLDGTLASQLRFVRRLPGVEQVRIVHVVAKESEAAATKTRLDAEAAGAGAGPEITSVVRIGKDPAAGIAAEAADWSATVVVISHRAHSAVHRAVWGSTARRLAKEYGTSLLLQNIGNVE
jgi:nucleotide-binding universal stress UspA family protein